MLLHKTPNEISSKLVKKCLRYPQSTRGSAMAEGLRDVLVSRNSATTKLEN